MRLMVLLFAAAAGQEVTVTNHLLLLFGTRLPSFPIRFLTELWKPRLGFLFACLFGSFLVWALYFMHSLQVWFITSPLHQLQGRWPPQHPVTLLPTTHPRADELAPSPNLLPPRLQGADPRCTLCHLFPAQGAWENQEESEKP